MTITKIPVRTVFDNSNNPVGLAEFQVGEVIAIAQGGTSANTVANARVNLNITDANIRSLFGVSGDLSYNNTTGIFSFTNDPGDIESVTAGAGLTGGGESGDVTLNVGGGYGITVNADGVQVSNTDIRALFSVVGSGSFNNTTGVITVTGGVESVGGFTGNVSNTEILSSVQNTGFFNTANVIEFNNLYFTDARANTSIDNRVTKSFVDNLGVDATTLDGIDSSAFALDTDFTTANVIELTNLYFTDARVNTAVASNLALKANVVDLTTANVAELTNLYYTNTRVDSFVTPSLTTANVIELTNLYFTNARSVASLVGQSVTMGEATITGNLFVLGNVVEFNTETLVIEDKNIVLANGAASASVANGAGITIDGAQAKLVYLSTGDEWQFNKNLNVQGSIAATGNITSPFFYSESDIALKENVNPISNALKKVLKLTGVDFIWKTSKQKAIGVIAQDVEKILPEIVGKSNSGFKTIQYDSLIPLLIEAIKEQQKQIDDLRKKVK